MSEDGWLCDISPDGTRLAVSRGPEGPIRILSLRGQPTQVIDLKELNKMLFQYWAADGKGLMFPTVSTVERSHMSTFMATHMSCGRIMEATGLWDCPRETAATLRSWVRQGAATYG
jgi:hypothetical protein